MTPARSRRLAVAAFLSALLAALALALDVTPARAVCAAEPDEDVSDLFSISPPAPDLTLQGNAPYQVTITFKDKTILSGPLTMSLTWGDGASSPVTIVDCGDDVYAFPVQQLSHTFNVAGQYPVQWHLSSPFIGQIDSLAVIVTVTGAQPTVTPVPPTSTSVPQPTATAGATRTPQPTVTAAAATETATGTPPPSSPSPSPTGSPTATVAAAAVATPTPTPVPQAPASGRIEPPKPEPGRPQTIRAVPEITDVSTDGSVVATNLVLAGVTIWVFFSSVLFNQTLSSHRSEVTGWFKGVPNPLSRVRSTSEWLPRGRWATAALVLIGTAVIYEFLEPSVGFNQATAVLFFSVLIGVGVVGFAFSGLEAWSRKRTLGVDATVSAFPLSLAVAAGSVIASRLLDLQPGVIYGFAASCVILSDVAGDTKREGRALLVPVVGCLLLSVVCWLFVGPAREIPVDWISHLLEAIAVIIFIGGLEGLLVNLIPLDVMDGAKIYRWNRIVWAILLAVCAFLFWHVLLNAERSYFDSLRKASSLSVLIGFLLYTAAGIGLWAYFRFRPTPTPAQS